jgi:hypothetical protein
MQLLQTRVDIFRGQVVISAPVGRGGVCGDITGRDNVFHHHFQMQLLQKRADIIRVWKVVISAPVGWGRVFGTLQAKKLHFVFISNISVFAQA